MLSLLRTRRGASVLAAATLASSAWAAPAFAETASFTSSGCSTWSVPAGVDSIDAIAVGSRGDTNQRGTGGSGARATATLAVTSGQSLRICVNVGGGASDASNDGGGASGVAVGTDFSTPVLIGAGGGGAAYTTSFTSAGGANGGNGGTPEGEPGASGGEAGGSGGTLSAGGVGAGNGTGTTANGPGVGGRGSSTSNGFPPGEDFAAGAGGGGGGGYFGGGGGYSGGAPSAGGGGGGSSFCAATLTDVSNCAFMLEPGSVYGVGAGAGLAKVTLSYVVKDTTPPVVRPTATGTEGSNGWYTSDVTLTWSVTDPESDVTSTSGCEQRVFTEDAVTDVACRPESAGGHIIASIRIRRDATKPTLDVVGGPADGGSYALGEVPAEPTCEASDETSGLDGDCLVTGYSTALGSHTITVSVQDKAGNATTKQVAYSVVDGTPPVIVPTVTGTLGENGWYTSQVEIGWRANDEESDISGGSGCEATSVVADTTGTTFTCELTSEGGTASESVTIKRDLQAPTLSIAGGPESNVDPYEFGSVPAAPVCSATDETSGVAEDCSVTGYSTELGDHTIEFRAVDVAGNVATRSISYSVVGTAPTIEGPAPNVVAGEDYSFAFDVDGVPSVTTTLASGALPPGISLADDGTLSGSSTVAGTYTFTVKASNSVSEVTSAPQSITVRPASPSELTYSSGDGQAAAIGAAFSKAPTVIVRDVFGNPVPGVTVRFAVATGSAVFTGNTSSRTATSNATGFAATALTAGKTAGTVRVEATIPSAPSVPAVLFTEAVKTAGTAKADLTVTLSGVPKQIEVGQTITVTVKVKNNGPQAATGVRTVLDPGQGLEVTAATGGTIAPLATAATWTASTLAKGATLTYTAKVKAAFRPWCGTARVRGTSLSSITDPALTNNAPAPIVQILEPSVGTS